jgi:hypothetical protein
MSSKKIKAEIQTLIDLLKKLHTTLPAHEKLIDEIGESIGNLQDTQNTEIMKHINNIKRLYKKPIGCLEIKHILLDLDTILTLYK